MCAASECAVKSKVCMKNLTIVPSYTEKNITCLLLLALLLVLCTRNNIDGNKLLIFSGIALYYGDTYMWQSCVEIEDYSITYFDRITVFEAPYR